MFLCKRLFAPFSDTAIILYYNIPLIISEHHGQMTNLKLAKLANHPPGLCQTCNEYDKIIPHDYIISYPSS